MAVYFHSSASEVNVEVGEYQEFTPSATGTASKSRFKQLNVVCLSFGILCVLQAVLNITLRLTLTRESETSASESFTTKIPALLNTTSGPRELRCPQNWLRFESSCYFISSQRGNFDLGRRDCERRGAQLVKIDNRQEQAFLAGLSAAAWVGMTDRNREGTWLWLDGTLVDKQQLQWAPGQPDDAFGGEDCGDLRTMKDFIGLNDSSCSNVEQWICEKPME